MKKKLSTVLLALAAFMPMTAQNLVKGDYGYLYCHMSDKGEWTAYAISRDGYNYQDINDGNPIFNPEEHARIEGGAELLDDRLDMAVVEQQALVVDVVDINDVDADLAQTVSRQTTILDRVRRAKDAAARRHKTELDLIHVRPPLVTCSVNRRMFRFVLFTKCFTLLFISLARNTCKR